MNGQAERGTHRHAELDYFPGEEEGDKWERQALIFKRDGWIVLVASVDVATSGQIERAIILFWFRKTARPYLPFSLLQAHAAPEIVRRLSAIT